MAKTKDTQKIEPKETKAAGTKPAVKKTHPAVKKTEKTPEIVAVKIAEIKVEDSVANDTLDASGRKKTDKYYESIGRRKTAIARVRLYTRGDKIFLVNDKPFDQYFKTVEFKNIIEAPLVKMNCTDRFRVTALVKGGGINAQAEALRHGITRALVLFNADFKKRLKKSGYLTRDPRMKERKKPGLKKARRAPQWA
ncbi:MAG: 30S ribosomal protein S9, partial [Minisyncoccales bacterium]